MKKLFAVFLAVISALSMCSFAVSAAETTKASSETAAASEPKTYAAAKSSVVGKWYSLGRISDTEAVFTYSKDGTFSISAGQDSISGRYSVVKNGLIKMTVKEAGDATIYIPAVMDNGMLLLSQDEIEYKDFKAYRSGQKLNDYFDDVPYFLSKKKPVKANQEDILGAWVVKLWEDDEFEEEGIFVFNKSSTTLISEYDTLTEAIVFKNGSPAQKGNTSDGYEFTGNDEFLYMCGDKLYVGDDDYMIILERYKKKTLTDKILEKAYDEDEYYYFKNGKLCFYDNIEKPVKYKIDGNYVSFTLDGQKYKLKAYITDNYIYLSGKDGTLTMLRSKPAKGQ